MFRMADRQVERVRAFSEGCDLDAGGREVRWIEDVRPADSAALLEGLVTRAERRDRTVNGALAGWRCTRRAGVLRRDPSLRSVRGTARGGRKESHRAPFHFRTRPACLTRATPRL
jgi:hypothetical protein